MYEYHTDRKVYLYVTEGELIMDNIRKLSEIMPGETVMVKENNSCGSIRRRLMDIGLVENATVECVGRSPLGDPSAYLIMGAVIAIRFRDSANILVESGGDASGHD